MDYKKPQSTIVHGGAGIYPLTTADQVILADGSRLEKDGKINVDSAAESSKLGGKAPEYYIQPRNLLDNSDFTNPVNQRGNGDVNTRGDYPIDRWMFDENGSGCGAGYDANYKYLYIVNNATDGSWGSLYHNVPSEKLNVGTYTICFHEKLIGPISMLVIADDTVTVLESAIYEPDENGLIIAQFTISSRPSNKLLIAVYASQGITAAFDWAALYEGSYTAETLPPYVPKGYAAELAECQRYFYKMKSHWKWVSAGICESSTKAYIPIVLPREMRIVPTVSITNPSLIKVKCGSIGTQIPSNIKWTYGILDARIMQMAATVTGATGGNVAFLYFDDGGEITFSADL